MNIELAPFFVQSIDWKLLKKQKSDLLIVLSKNESITEEQIESLSGILHLIDGIQDYAVDICGVPETEVFDTEN